MARNGQRLEFPTFTSMAAHLDRWAETHLASPTGWEDALSLSRAWLDYSARNQILLASYGVDGPVAGPETWRLVPSTTEGRGCAVRAGEHGWPVRVPVTTGGTEPDPYLGGHRPTRAAVERWEWRPVFEIAQLARRPALDALTPLDLPDTLTGQGGHLAYGAAVRKVAGATVRGSLPRSQSPEQMLMKAAGRLRRSHTRPALDPELRQQVAWLVADRVHRAGSDRPSAFDPSALAPRERWERLQDVLEPARKLTAALGVTLGVDLLASPLPRMEIVDDRVVPAGRRHRLPAASLAQLPVGRWVTVGPYTTAEWAARGEHATGLGAFLRLNTSAYLVAVETGGDGAAWRLEDTAARTGHGLLATGGARTLDDARAAAVTAVRDRYPAPAPTADATPSPGGTRQGWEQMARGGQAAAAQVRHLTDQVTLYVLPAPGGRWQPAIHTPTTLGLDLLPLQRSIDDARAQAELAGRRVVRAGMVADPARADQTVAAFAGDPAYSRPELARLIGSRLSDSDAARVETAQPAELVELLGAAGLSPATTVAVLAAEQVDAIEAAILLPIVGVPMADAIRVLHDRWEMPGVTAAELLGATAAEMRAAGCTPVEIMAACPRDILRALPSEPRLWELAAATMADGGHPTTTIVAHLVAHAPTPDAFAAGLSAVTEPADTLAVAARCRAHPDQLAAASEAIGLSPADTAAALASLIDDHAMLDTLVRRCDGDHDAATTLAIAAGVNGAAIEAWSRPLPAASVTSIRSSVDLDTAALLDALPPPRPAHGHDPIALFDGIEPTAVEPHR
ncbi:MAG: hypothetical protein AB7H92_14745 [Microbacteriaceae bacterium]